MIEERHAPNATTLVGFDDDLDRPVAEVRFRARINAYGHVEVGALGAGAWNLRVGGHTFRIVEGAAILRPPHRTEAVDVPEGTELSGGVEPLAGVGLFGIVARPASRRRTR